MRTATFVPVLFASLVLSACAADPVLGMPPREVAAPGLWGARPLYVVVPTRELPTVDTTAQRQALRRVPHGVDHVNLTSGQR